MQTQETIDNLVKNYLRDCRARRLAPGSITFYSDKLAYFQKFCQRESIELVQAVTPDTLRDYLISIEHHRPGGQHALYRAVRACLRWFEAEYEPEGYKNPTHKVKAPRVPEDILEPVADDTVAMLIETCTANWYGIRDKAIILTLIETGVRSHELIALNVPDFDAVTGDMVIRQGKGRKPRMVFVSRKGKRAIRAWAKLWGKDDGPLFVNRYKERFGYDGLREIMQTRAATLGIKPPSLHSFRRAFALNCLRGGMDVFTLQRLMGHSDLTTLRRYLAQTTEDLREGYIAAMQ